EEHGLYNLYVIYYDKGAKTREKVCAYMKQIAESEVKVHSGIRGYMKVRNGPGWVGEALGVEY
ncbi:hypothetical protein Tsubulata_024326, partial [Turnera subulata]